MDFHDIQLGDLIEGPSKTVYRVVSISASTLFCETSSEYSPRGEIVQFPAWAVKHFSKVNPPIVTKGVLRDQTAYL